MINRKRILLLGTTLLFAALGVGLYAAPSRPVKCGQQPTKVALFLQKTGIIEQQKMMPCETASPGIPGEWCVNDGHHCRDANGPGKCTSVFDNAAEKWTCVCMAPGKH